MQFLQKLCQLQRTDLQLIFHDADVGKALQIGLLAIGIKFFARFFTGGVALRK